MIVRPDIAGDLSQPEVGNPKLAAQVQEQVARLDVAVHDARLVSVFQRQRRLAAQAGDAVEILATVRGPLVGDGRCGERGLFAARISGVVTGNSAAAASVALAASRLGTRQTPIPLVAKAAQLSDQRGQALPLDELHRVVVDAALAADRVHRDDLLVLHVRRGQRLCFEALEAARVDGRGERQDLQRDPPPQRDLLGLVNDPHPASAHLTHDAKVAELADDRREAVRSIARRATKPVGFAPRACAEGRHQPFHFVVVGEERLEVVAVGRGVPPRTGRGRALGRPRLPRRKRGGFSSAALPARTSRVSSRACCASPESRSSSRSRFSPRKSRPTAAGRVRPICCATSATASPSR